jgi:hypothetical protein
MRFQVLMAASIKMAVFWDVAPYSLLRTYRLDGGGSKHISNVSKLLPDYTAQHPRR